MQNVSEPSNDHLVLTRRRFLDSLGKTSVAGALSLYSGSTLALVTSSGGAYAEASPYKVLRPVDAKYFGSVLPAVISQAQTDEDVHRHLQSFDMMLSPVSSDTLKRIQRLVNFVTGVLTRVPMTGTLTDWPDLSIESIDRIFGSWRKSSFELPVLAYSVTTQLISTAWYMAPENQEAIGYPGPPKKIVY